MTTILRIDSSATGSASMTRRLTDRLVAGLAGPDDRIVVRDLNHGVPLLSTDVVADLVTPAGQRANGAEATLTVADEFISELQAADIIVIGAPIYNFGVPAAVKAWADLVARAGTTFAYTDTGPTGLLVDRPTYVVSASGGTSIGSDLDFGTTWLTQFLAFLGLTNVTVVGAEGLAMDPEGAVSRAEAAIAALV